MGAEHQVVSRQRRGLGRVVVFVGVVLAIAIAAAGCGRKGHGAATDSEKASDVAILNDSLAWELTAVAAYDRALPLLSGRSFAIAREFRGQDQAHVDGLTKAIRGLGGETEAEAIAPEQPQPPPDRRGALTQIYEAENAALAQDLDAPPRLQTSAPRAVTAAVAAGHAQHLAILRQLLGASLAAAVPQPYESGEEPPPASPAAGQPPNKG
jgi:hypothetical protein